ncbi:ABC-type amino acid transport substrate-binding protein [Duganella sp. 1411]|uniref:hypothetical protein n=1 Tax=Duganella sp. 1411 TaxID=2806572 RepID=UPI001B67624F|nr:hypothetical protein [Duganella sp. 1411]MBP1205153.1 ABC-type amino acid transport substrate-binding protein [Duganella sp. 1411]
MVRRRGTDAGVDGAGRLPADAVELAFNLSVDGVYFAFSKGTPEATVTAWADALRDIKRDGSFLKIHQKWLPAAQLPPDVAAPPTQPSPQR